MLLNEIDIDQIEAILRVEFGSTCLQTMSSKELKRDAVTIC